MYHITKHAKRDYGVVVTWPAGRLGSLEKLMEDLNGTVHYVSKPSDDDTVYVHVRHCRREGAVYMAGLLRGLTRELS